MCDKTIRNAQIERSCLKVLESSGGPDPREGGITVGIYPERCSMHEEIIARCDLSVLSDKPVPLAAIAELG